MDLSRAVRTEQTEIYRWHFLKGHIFSTDFNILSTVDHQLRIAAEYGARRLAVHVFALHRARDLH